jgi:hypothetical protein
MGGDGTTNGHGRSDYAAVNGSDEPWYAFQPPGTRRGIFGYNSRTSIRDVTDGTSATFMLGERYWDGIGVDANTKARGALWAGRPPGGPNNAGNKYATLLRTNDSAAFTINGTNNNAARSMHVGGVHFVFADGGVHFLNQNMSPTNYRRLGQMADNLPVDEY